MNLIQHLARRELVVVTGKGGVGKSTLSVTIGSLLAARGRRALVLETDPRESLHQLLDVHPSDGAIVPAGPRLRIQNLKTRAVHEAMVRERVKVAALAKRIVANPVFQHFTAGAPGLNELAVLAHARRLVQGGRSRKADVVVLDAPATGHGVSMLTAPQLVSEVIPRGPVGDLARELAQVVADPDRCAVVIVTLAEEMAVQEAVELVLLLDERLDRRPEVVVVNALYPPLPRPRPLPPPGGAELLGVWVAHREANEREIARLVAAWPGPRIELPLLPIERGPHLVAELGRLLAGGTT